MQELFSEVSSSDILEFEFGPSKYRDQLDAAILKTNQFCAVTVTLRDLTPTLRVVWVAHNFGFMGGSLGCAEGEKVTRAFEYALEHELPVIVQCKTGGARMQEGTLSLMQMAKVSVAVQALRKNPKCPFISLLEDPTYGGVSASYAMQADVKIGVRSTARIGFAGPSVILNTMFEMDQAKYDSNMPPDFQSASYVQEKGQIDMVIDEEEGVEDFDAFVASKVANICAVLTGSYKDAAQNLSSSEGKEETSEEKDTAEWEYSNARHIQRCQVQDYIDSLFGSSFVKLTGDGKIGTDKCMVGGIGLLKNAQPCVVVGTRKGHDITGMEEANFGMSSPHGYRTALRLMLLAQRFSLPLVTLVDTCGAWPSFQAEQDGQSEAIATNLLEMASLTVPIVSVVVGEGGSGGALGIAMGNLIGMMSGAYYGVISPEGAASILGRYKDDQHKAKQFPLDCKALAEKQRIYANQLQELGVIDSILWEESNTCSQDMWEASVSLVGDFIAQSLMQLASMEADELVQQRYGKFRDMGRFELFSIEEKEQIVQELKEKLEGKTKKRASRPKNPDGTAIIQHVASETVNGEKSKYKGKTQLPLTQPPVPTIPPNTIADRSKTNAKAVLDAEGPEAMARWVKNNPLLLVTDTSMRDAHQSLIATRVRTKDLVEGAKMTSALLHDAFSLEMWGGATFDVAYRFLFESPWDRLRQIREACPNICLQMLIRGANGVGYSSYPKEVVSKFIELAALNGIDIFRIFDCFNDIDNMRNSIAAVKAQNKVAEVCICYTSDILTSDIYNEEYYYERAKEVIEAGAHIIGVKDMAGLLRPPCAKPLLSAIHRACVELNAEHIPVHFHSHNTSSLALATAVEMMQCEVDDQGSKGCDVIDFAAAGLSDLTSQPNMNSFLGGMRGLPNAPSIDFETLEPLDQYWRGIREIYSEHESGLRSGTASVFSHHIPGGQYSNLLAQCKATWGEEGWSEERWGQVCDMYRRVNFALGDIIKVTPSSKSVGDLALTMVNRGYDESDLLDASISWPESVVQLMDGSLGFPHRGFPEPIVRAILKLAPEDPLPSKEQVLQNASSTVNAAVDWEDVATKLSELAPTPSPAYHHLPFLPAPTGERMETGGVVGGWDMEDLVAYMLYPKVFVDFLTKINETSPVLTLIPSPIAISGMDVGSSFDLPVEAWDWVFTSSKQEGEEKNGEEEKEEGDSIHVELKRIGGIMKEKRTLLFELSCGSHNETQQVIIKDNGDGDGFTFTGQMADADNEGHVASPMRGLIDTIMVSVGDEVEAGQTLLVVSAMKVEVNIPFAGFGEGEGGVVSNILMEEGENVVEGALLIEVSPRT